MGITLITLNQLSDECGISPRELSEAIRNGELIAERVGGRWVIDRGDADSYLSESLCNDGDDDADFDDEDDDLDDEDDFGEEGRVSEC
jgi:hypothetical protein